MRLLVAIALVLCAATPASAYPQFQLAKDATCTGCHLSPAGGGQLSENGLNVAETISQWGTAPEFLYGLVPAPPWLSLGGDLRSAAGLSGSPDRRWVKFPMQAEIYADAHTGGLSVHVTAGARDPEYQRTAATLFGSREHWVQWQQHPGETEGMVVRAGRFMPVFGLRLAEHPAYVRRFGGTPLYGEAYGASASYVRSNSEVHATGFHRDPLLSTTQTRGNGGALYAELRIMSKTSVGVEALHERTTDDRRTHVGATAKHMFERPQILLQGELQVVHQKVLAGGINNQLVAYVMGSYFLGDTVMIDLACQAYAPNLGLRYLDQEAVDLNVHWFPTSHVEVILTNRFQMLELGAGGNSSGYSLLQLHYRL